MGKAPCERLPTFKQSTTGDPSAVFALRAAWFDEDAVFKEATTPLKAAFVAAAL